MIAETRYRIRGAIRIHAAVSTRVRRKHNFALKSLESPINAKQFLNLVYQFAQIMWFIHPVICNIASKLISALLLLAYLER